jgi:diguanylate cyclase
MLDLDHFKEVNDQYGHLAGDKVLIQIAAGLKRSVRTVDFVARYGGEEFAIILVETELDKGIYTAERIRSYIEKIETYYKGDIITVTVSIGAAEFPNSSKDFETLVAEADKALYQAKTGGRNRVVAYHGEAETNINNYNQSGN